MTLSSLDDRERTVGDRTVIRNYKTVGLSCEGCADEPLPGLPHWYGRPFHRCIDLDCKTRRRWNLPSSSGQSGHGVCHRKRTGRCFFEATRRERDGMRQIQFARLLRDPIEYGGQKPAGEPPAA